MIHHERRARKNLAFWPEWGGATANRSCDPEALRRKFCFCFHEVRLAPSFHIVSRTDHELVVIKPAGMACELTTDPLDHSLIAAIKRELPGTNPRLPHRLDRITRGIVVVALSREAAAFHGEHLKNREWRKFYLARTRDRISGRFADLIGTHKAFMKTVGRTEKIVRAGGQPSFLEVIAAEKAPGHSGQLHVLVRLMTGRRHQVRVMLANLGLPLVADPLYGERLGKLEKDSFYLEHILLDYPSYFDGERRTVYVEDWSEREEISPAMIERILLLKNP
jgi:23S rRNA-/tRNA-specific pseudouridylate synthase